MLGRVTRCCHVSQRRLLGFALVVAVSIFLTAAASARQPALSFRNPFHPEQCDRAIAAGRMLATQGEARMHLLLAEGLLCKGLDDDPGALDAAIDMFQQIVVAEPSNFYAQLELADALRKRFPLSDDARAALERTRAALETADVGAARPQLVQYVAENQAAIENQRTRSLPVLQARQTAYAAGTLSPAEMAQFVDLLILTGPDGQIQAGRSLEAYLTHHSDDALETLYRAETLRGHVRRDAARALYADAETRLCRSAPPAPEGAECSKARWRLQQLQNVDNRNGGAGMVPSLPNIERRKVL